MGKIHDRFKQKRAWAVAETIDTSKMTTAESLKRVQSIVVPGHLNEMQSENYIKYQLKLKDLKKYKGRFDGLCNRRACLTQREVHWYNWGSYAFYCKDCARMLNRANYDVTVAIGKPDLCSLQTVESEKECYVI